MKASSARSSFSKTFAAAFVAAICAVVMSMGSAVGVAQESAYAVDGATALQAAGGDLAGQSDDDGLAGQADGAEVVASGTCGDNLSWTLDADGELAVAGTGDMTQWQTDSSVPWYSHRSKINSVVVADGVTSIGSRAFRQCTNIKSVSGCASVTSVGDYAFQSCSQLTGVAFGDALKSIGDYAFQGCELLRTADLGTSLESVGASAFKGCLLQDVTLPGTLTVLGANAFENCTSLESVTLSAALGEIAPSTFKGCTSLTAIALPASVAQVGDTAFQNCTALATITVADKSKIDSISATAFQNCTALATVETTSKYVCNYVRDVLKKAALYDAIVASLPVDASSSLRYAYGTGGQGVWIVGITETTSFLTVPSAIAGAPVVGIAEGAFTIRNDSGVVIDNTDLREIAFEEGSQIAAIEASAFEKCSSLVSFSVPAPVTDIGARAFNGCKQLSTFSFADGSALKSIGERALQGCTSLDLVAVPSTVEAIGKRAFEGVKTVTFANNASAIAEVGAEMFYGCANVVLGEGTQVVSGGFSSALVSVTLPESLQRIEADAFAGCNKLGEVRIPDSVSSIGDWAFRGCSALSSVSFSAASTLASIGIGAFSSCAKLVTFDIPNSVTSLGDQAFNGCRGLQSIRIPAQVSAIGTKAFYNCSSLTSLTFAEGTTLATIGESAFENCKALTRLDVPASLVKIGDKAFKGALALAEISFADNSALNSIGLSAFENCKALESLNLPASVEWVYGAAFKNCSKLETVTLNSQDMYLGPECFVGIANPSIIYTVSDTMYAKLAENANLIDNEATYNASVGDSMHTITADDVTVADTAYTGPDTRPGVTVVCDGVTLSPDTDYDVVFEEALHAGEGVLLVRGKGSYVGYARKPFTIFAVQVAVPTAQVDLVYDGVEKQGVATSDAYTVKNSAATNAGDYTAVVSLVDKVNCVWADGSGSDDKQIQWSVERAPVTVTVLNATKVYGDKDPSFTAKVEGVVGGNNKLVKYTIAREKGEDVGDYAISATGEAVQGNYAVTFAPGTLAIEKRNLSAAVVKLASTSVVYTGAELKPGVSSVKLGSKLLEAGVDYSVSYADNVDPGTATAIVTGIGNNTGTASQTFTIASVVDVPKPNEGLVYNGTEQQGIPTSDAYTVKRGSATDAGEYKAVLSLVDKNKYSWADSGGTADKTVSWTIERAPVTVRVNNASKVYGDRDPAFSAVVEGALGNDADRIRYSCSRADRGEDVGDYGIKAVGLANQGNYAVTFVPGTISIRKMDLSAATVKLAKTELDYTGSAVEPAVSSVKVGTKILRADTDYDITYMNNVNAGTASVVVTGKGNYEGAASQSFTIKSSSTQPTTPDQPQEPGIAVGATAQVGGAAYKANSASTVVYQKAPTAKKKVKVPANVTINGKRYAVVGIAAKAFKGAKAKTVVVKTKKLKKSTVRKCFKKSKVKIVKVPKAKKKAYKKIFTKKNCGKKVKVK